MDISARLDELRQLKDGWFEGKGLAPKQDGLDWLTDVFEKYYPDDLSLPYIYPTAEGNIQAEWSIKPNEASLEIDLKSHKGEWHCLNLDSNAEDTDTLNLEQEQNWELLIDKLRKLSGVRV